MSPVSLSLSDLPIQNLPTLERQFEFFFFDNQLEAALRTVYTSIKFQSQALKLWLYFNTERERDLYSGVVTLLQLTNVFSLQRRHGNEEYWMKK